MVPAGSPCATLAHATGGVQARLLPGAGPIIIVKAGFAPQGARGPSDDHMSSPIKLISTDFDGTLFAEFEMPPVPRSLERLIGDLQQDGTRWVINTGRDMSSLMESLGRAHLSIQPDYLILVEREIHVHDGHRYAGLESWNDACTREHVELFQQVRPQLPPVLDWINARFNATIYEDAYSPFCLIADNEREAETIHKHLDGFCQGIPGLTVMRNDVYARFSHERYNKGTALAEVARHAGCTAKEVFAAGDHLNDLPMLSLEHARWLVAPDNAIAQVKEAVRRQNGFVSRRAHGEGVAEGLTFALGK